MAATCQLVPSGAGALGQLRPQPSLASRVGLRCALHHLRVRRKQSACRVSQPGLPLAPQASQACGHTFRRSTAAVVCSATSGQESAAEGQYSQADKSLVTKFGLWRAACLFGVTFILGGLSTALLLVPPEVLFGQSLTREGVALVQAAGVSLWPTAAIFAVVADAARNNRLSSDSYKRLGAAGFVCFYLLCWCAWSDLGILTPLGLVAQRFVLMSLMIDVYLRGAPVAPPEVRPTLKLLYPQKGWKGWKWQVAAVLAMLLIPRVPQVMAMAVGETAEGLLDFTVRNSVRTLLASAIQVATVSVASAAIVMVDATRRDRLKGTTFKVLRWSVRLAAVGWALVLASAATLPGTILHRAAQGALCLLSADMVLEW
eukprot:CAMPEP_0206139900 /NCGR_PEP_ID=MMETSP1473-20131121/7760_1 /ASSEMBLY_ACC=CAM_ASM_001109 /TAXON_ID=1461547 /ORGANISM="Stichococcus sp, Strain RCC1054" /LENGTH=371 /DNA_ID=CAMNT_0053533847 /DNA_START=107 /DNA_END=1219 /DNA_ORIENTATION=-